MILDLVVFIVLLIVVVFFFKRFSSFIYFIGIVDVFLRLFAFIKATVEIPEVYNLLNRIGLPTSIPAILSAYSTGIFYTILAWGYIICMLIFLYYITMTFFRKK